MTPKAREYIVSERFIHDALANRAHQAVERAYALWRRDGFLTPTVLFWPSDTVLTVTGEGHEGVVVSNLPDVEARPKFFAEALRRLNPYGVLTVEITPQRKVEGTFETHHGTRHWERALRSRSEISILGPEVTTDNHHYLGVLWTPDRGAA